jgi:phosphohistidine phosphatase SixA
MLTSGEVRAAVWAAARRLRSARIDAFVDVLAERYARADLRRWLAHGSGPGGMSGCSVTYVARHALAGDKQQWAGRDADRPLDDKGRNHAVELARWFEGLAVSRLVTSPTRRCMETLTPLAHRLGIDEIEVDERLAVGADADALIDGVTNRRWDRAVVCTHGELMRPLIAALRARGAEIIAETVDDDWLLTKGGVWAIEHDATTARRITHAAPGHGWASATRRAAFA